MRRLLITGIVLLLLQFLLADEALPDTGQACVIKWWGDRTGYVTTNETSRTEQARHEAFQAVFFGRSGCSGPCFTFNCFICSGHVPEGCDGIGDGVIDVGCYAANLCDTGKWEYCMIYDVLLHTMGFWDVLCGIDTDSDSFPDLADNCVDDYNPFQIDCDNDGVGDVCDADTVDPDSDGVDVACDNCPDTPSENQADSYPAQGNGIGDACDCEGDFQCDGDVDGSDASLFKSDFGRSVIVEPCTGESPCNGDFNCDGDADGTDAALFKADFGRSSIQNPCPLCVAGVEWCGYQ